MIVGVSLDAAPVACSPGGLLMVCTAPRIHVLGIRLSEMEIGGWSVIVGAVMGGLLGYFIALLTRRGPAHATPSSAPEAPA